MVSLSALIQRFSKDGTAPTGVRKHVGVSGAVTMTVSTLGGTSYAKHPVPDRQTTLMPPVSPLSSTLATTPEGGGFLKKHPYRHSAAHSLLICIYPLNTNAGTLSTNRKMQQDYYYSHRDLNDMAVWPEGHRAGLRAAAPALTLLTPVLAALCGVPRRTVRKQGKTTMNSITRNSTYFHCPSANFNVMLAFSFLPF